MIKMGEFTEFLFTYGWAILVVVVAFGSLAYFGVFTTDFSEIVDNATNRNETSDGSCMTFYPDIYVKSIEVSIKEGFKFKNVTVCGE